MTSTSMTTDSRIALRGDLLDFTDDPGFAAPAGAPGVRFRPNHWLLVDGGRIAGVQADAPDASWQRIDHAGNLLSVEQTITVFTESIVQALGRSRVFLEPRQTANIPDLLFLSNSLDPTFESWKNQIQAKLAVNTDYFANNTAKIVYIFTCISGNT